MNLSWAFSLPINVNHSAHTTIFYLRHVANSICANHNWLITSTRLPQQTSFTFSWIVGSSTLFAIDLRASSFALSYRTTRLNWLHWPTTKTREITPCNLDTPYIPFDIRKKNLAKPYHFLYCMSIALHITRMLYALGQPETGSCTRSRGRPVWKFRLKIKR